MTTNNYEVIIIGGSYAGLSAAMSLGRSLRKVLIIDSGLPCNRQTPHSHNFITHDGETPAAIAHKAKAQVLAYSTVKFVTDLATSGKKVDDYFEINTQSGQAYTAQKLIFATGIADQMPGIKGFADCWGITVIHCPYCHGYEFKNEKTAIMANGERAMHLASMVYNLSKDVTLVTNGPANFNAEQMSKLQKNGIDVIETELTEVVHENGHIKELIFADGSQLPFTAVYAVLPFKQHSAIPLELGCELTEMGYIKVDNMQKTTIDGVFACGDNASPLRAVANAVYSGNFAGAVVNRELSEQAF